jgi:hypothetical protein
VGGLVYHPKNHLNLLLAPFKMDNEKEISRHAGTDQRVFSVSFIHYGNEKSYLD